MNIELSLDDVKIIHHSLTCEQESIRKGNVKFSTEDARRNAIKKLDDIKTRVAAIGHQMMRDEAAALPKS